MRKVLEAFVSLGAYTMAASLDFMIGVYIVALHTLVSVHPIPLWQFAFGGALALLPDILDLLWPALRHVFLGKKIDDTYNHHHTLAHRPAVVLPLAMAVAWLLGGEYWALNALFCVSWHYLHDTWPLSSGGGIAWVWPLSNRYISWRGFEPTNTHVPPVDAWMEEMWLQPSRLARTEVTIATALFALAVPIVADHHHVNLWLQLLIAISPALGATLIWSMRWMLKRPR